jgi:hypothetical protein
MIEIGLQDLSPGAIIEVTYGVPVVWVNNPPPLRSREPVPIASCYRGMRMIAQPGTTSGEFVECDGEFLFMRRAVDERKIAIATNAIQRINRL